MTNPTPRCPLASGRPAPATRRPRSRFSSELHTLQPLEQRLLLSDTAGPIFVRSDGGGAIGEFTAAGATINLSFANPSTAPDSGIAVSGSDVFVANYGTGDFGTGAIDEYTLSGALVGEPVTDLFGPIAVAVSGSDLFVADMAGGEAGQGTIAEYTTSVTVVNSRLIGGLTGISAIAVSGAEIFVASRGTQGIVGAYSTSGQAINESLITGLYDPSSLAASGSDLYIANGVNRTVSQYSLFGNLENASLFPLTDFSDCITASDSDLFVTNDDFGAISEYTTSGSLVNASLVSKLDFPAGIAIDLNQPVGTPTQLAFGQQPTNITAGNTIGPAISVVVEDHSGNVVSTDNSTVTLSISGGSSGLLLGTTTAAAVDGVATFSGISLTKAGAYKLTATDGAFSGQSASFTVKAAKGELAFVQNPTDLLAGHVIAPAITVSLADSFGNPISGTKVRLTIASGPAGTVLNGDFLVIAENGIATFNAISLFQAGGYTLTAKHGSLAPALSNRFVVSPAAVSQIAFFRQPTNTIAGAVITPAVVVEFQDQFGNLVTTQNDNVTVDINSGASMNGATTVSTVNGVATFGNLSVTQAGTYRLTAVAGTYNAKSSKFTISSAAAANLAFVQNPTPAVAGQLITPDISVSIMDLFGNPITGAKVKLSISDGPSGAVLNRAPVAVSQNGLATFSDFSLPVAGTYTLAATHGSLAPINSNNFAVTPAAAAELVFIQQPSNTPAASPLNPPPSLAVEDAFGNLVATDDSQVSVAIKRGPVGAVLSGTLTTSVGDGIAIFNDLLFDTPGNYRLIANDGGLTSARSAKFSISAAI